MILDDEGTYYDILELNPDASPKDIREAYLRLKAAYGKDSVALYTLISKEDTEEMVRKIEAAYRVLSDPDKRIEYDRNHQIARSDAHLGLDLFQKATKKAPEKIIHADDVPLSGGEDLLSVPPIETPSSIQSEERMLSSPPPSPSAARLASMPATESAVASAGAAPEALVPTPFITAAKGSTTPAEPYPSDVDVERESEWAGATLKHIREHQNISIEELSEFTKITKRYIRAIEDEDYTQLPASVYLRGFVAQIAKRLRLPHEKVATAYVARYRRACPDKT